MESAGANETFSRRNVMLAMGAATVLPLVRVGPASGAPSVTLSDLVLQVGADESKRNLSWMSTEAAAEYVEVALASAMTDLDFPVTGTRFTTTYGAANTSGEFFQRATVSGLAENTDYVYRIGSDSAGWSDTYSFATAAFSGAFSFLFVGDPQIGASGNAANDSAGWSSTLRLAESEFPDAEFVLTGGDQIDSAADESQFGYFLAPEQLTSIPLATNIGNHDVASPAYLQHFNMPNISDVYGLGSAGQSGGNHWFRFRGALFISLNTNNGDTDGHLAFVQQVMADQPEATWTVVSFHHSVFSVANHAFESDIVALREALPAGFSDLGVDLVLMGHDHHYTRAYLMNGTDISSTEADGVVSGTVVPDEGDVLYLTANSSSGSKYYVSNARFEECYWSDVSDQQSHPNFTYVTMGEDSITLETYDTSTGTMLDSVTLAPEVTTDPTDPGGPGDPTDGGSTSYATHTGVSLSKRTQTRGAKPARVTVSVRVPGTTKAVKGRVKIFDGGHVLKAATLKRGKAVITLPRHLTVGQHRLHAVYLENGDFERSVSRVVTMKVKRPRRH